MNLENVRDGMAEYQADASGDALSMALELGCAARSDMCVLLSGQPAAVQDIAYRIHAISGWRHGEFLILDCERNENLVERLFTSPMADDMAPRAGAATGLRLVQAGSVLLQEVGRLSTGTQERLASHLATSRLESRYGRSRWRLIASTSEPLLDRVTAGTFNDRLFYRLNTIHLAVPTAGPLPPTGTVM